jgi:hypothetical protein
MAASLSWTDSDGNPAVGALQLEAAFTDIVEETAQAVAVQRDLGGYDLSGQTLTAEVKLVSGFHVDPDEASGCAQIYLQSGEDWVWANGDCTALVEGEWVTLSVDADEPASVEDDGDHDPSQIMRLGIQLYSGTEGSFTDTVALIDGIVAE